jgi:hypothetical protein
MFELTDEAFACVQPLLPANSRRGKPWREHRQVLGGIIWKLHTGRPWRDVPGRFGPWQPAMAGCVAGRSMGPGPGYGRCWPPAASWAHATVEVASSAMRWVRRRQWQHVGAGLVAAPPHRPPQHLAHRGWRPPRQPDQQPTRLRGRDPDQVRPWRLWRFCAVSCPPCLPGRRERLGRGPPPGTPGRPGPGHMPIPGVPATNLVVVQADLVLAAWKHSSHRPADPGDLDQLGQGGVGRAEAGVEGQLPVRQPPPGQQPEPAARPAGPGQRDPGPVIDPGALGAIAGAEAPPGAGGQARRPVGGRAARRSPARRAPTAAGWP